MTHATPKLGVFLLAILANACGSGGGSPTSPTPSTPAAPAATRIISLGGNLAFGEVQVGSSRSATLTISNGGNATLTVSGLGATGGIVAQSSASWTSGTIAPGASQQVTITFRPTTAGTFAGTVTVDADHTSGTNSIPISGTAIDAAFAGNWSGNYIVERCDGAGSIQDVLCSAPSGSRPGGVFPVGTSLPITLTLNQSGNSVTGTFALGTVRGVATGVVTNGLLTLQGTATGGTLTAVITHWSTRAQGNVMDGFANYNITISGVPGIGGLVTRLGRVTK
jgi:hypothetical protein